MVISHLFTARATSEFDVRTHIKRQPFRLKPIPNNPHHGERQRFQERTTRFTPCDERSPHRAQRKSQEESHRLLRRVSALVPFIPFAFGPDRVIQHLAGRDNCEGEMEVHQYPGERTSFILNFQHLKFLERLARTINHEDNRT